MSFDLYFYKKKDAIITEENLADYLTRNLPFNISEIPQQWNYENPVTGVYFLIDWNEKNDDPEEIKYFDNFEEFQYLNFSCSVNFFRPRYFGIEIFPIIEKIIKDLDLFVLNPQDELDTGKPKKFFEGYLQDQWIRHNDGVSLDNFDKLNLLYLPLDKSNYIWQYLYNKQKLEDSIKEDIYVPDIFIMKDKNDGQLYTVCAWTQHIPFVLPQVDYLFILKKYKRLFRSIEERGVVHFKTIMDEFGDSFEYLENSVPHLKVLRQDNANKIGKRFNELKLEKPVTEFGTLVGKDYFVNVRP